LADLTILPIPGFAEPVSSFTHLGGAAVFLILAIPLLYRGRGHLGRVLSLGVFAFTCVFLLSMSGVYHLLPHGSGGRAVLQRLDHSGIFALIAGTFTPVHAILFKGLMRWIPLFLIWAAAATGITLKTIFFTGIPNWLGLTLYLSMGWVGAAAGLIILFQFGWTFFKPLIIGAMAYTIGAAFEFLNWPVVIPGVIESHELLHVCVLVGVAYHWRFVSQFASGEAQRTDGPERLTDVIRPGNEIIDHRSSHSGRSSNEVQQGQKIVQGVSDYYDQ
jgi:channel protein (hemolysin III family)